MHILAYCLYVLSTVFVIVYVGNYFYKNGRAYLLTIYNNNILLTNSVNKILLIGYYLLNIGYAFATLKATKLIIAVSQLMEWLSFRVGLLILMLACVHYVNMLWVRLLVNKKNKINHL